MRSPFSSGLQGVARPPRCASSTDWSIRRRDVSWSTARTWRSSTPSRYGGASVTSSNRSGCSLTSPWVPMWPRSRDSSGGRRTRQEARIEELLDLVGLDPAVYRDRYPHELSGGQQQRVGVARALGADPPVLLMDEPFGAIDPVTRVRLQEELVAIQAGVRKTIVFVTHDIEEAVKLGDRIVILAEDGTLAQVGDAGRPAVAPGVRVRRGLRRRGPWSQAARRDGDPPRRASSRHPGDVAAGRPAYRGRCLAERCARVDGRVERRPCRGLRGRRHVVIRS